MIMPKTAEENSLLSNFGIWFWIGLIDHDKTSTRDWTWNDGSKLESNVRWKSDSIADMDKRVIITCDVKYTQGTTKLFWTRSVNGTSMIVSQYATGGNVTSPSLVFEKVKWTDEGLYRCHVINISGLTQTDETFLLINATNMCPCRCEYRRKLEHWGSKIIPNLTREELLKELNQKMFCFVRLLVISVFPLLIESQLSKLTCPTGWESHGFKCYKISHQYFDFSNATKYCNDHNAELIMPKTVEEQNIMKTLLRQVKSTNVDDGIWIGLNFNASYGKWIWNDGTQLDSANMAWNPGEPQYFPHENCVVSPRNTEKWHDVTCHTNHVFSAACQLKDMIVNEGESVNLTCGVSDLQTKWTRSVNDTSVIVSEYANNLNLPSLVLDYVKWSDQGSYKCSFTNTAGLLETRLTRLFVNTSTTEMCPCRCDYRRHLEYWESKIPRHQTLEELKKELEPVIRKIQNQLKINKTKLSSTIRKLTSAKDERKSSQTIGFFGALFISVIFGIVFCMDLLIFRQHIDKIRKICGYKKKNRRQKLSRKRNHEQYKL
ncbi:unnamed protein product [Mytilus edulis]|uniref:Uncharacterized protein n=1 Tax=Mytilus edulis TaxID=6550 RepID=A0A8S3UVH5_MYTED|nr:unnamed protein product [Mytilus edulis]